MQYQHLPWSLKPLRDQTRIVLVFGSIPVYLVIFNIFSPLVSLIAIPKYCAYSGSCVNVSVHSLRLNLAANSSYSNETVSTLIPKKKAVSPVQGRFGQCNNSKGSMIDSDVAVCRQFHSNVQANGGNISIVLSHLRVHHSAQYTHSK